jgi:hypothetical protein
MPNDQKNDTISPDAGALPIDEIPVEELIRITREFTRRITNQDRQRLALDLRESGHQRSIQVSAPVALQLFFSGEIDLDPELARRFINAPLLSHVRFIPELGEPARRQASAILSSQDDSAIMTVDAPINNGADACLEFTFTLFSSLALRFTLQPLVTVDRRRWLDLMRRESGIAFLWTRSRWEQSYIIFVVREHFARLYAFSPFGFEAAARLTPEMVTGLLDWLEGLWFPGEQPPRETIQAQRPTLITRPEPHSPVVEPPQEDTPPQEEDDLAAGDLEW